MCVGGGGRGEGGDLGRPPPSFGEGNKMVDIVANVLDRYLIVILGFH